MSDIDDGGELSPAAKAFLSQHQATGEPSGEELERGLQRLTAPTAAPAPAADAKVLPLRRRRPFLLPEVLAAAAVVTLLLGAQGLYLLLRAPEVAPVVKKDVLPKPSAERELEAISAAWVAGDYEQVKRLASRECASDECRPLASELTKMLDRAQHPGTLTPEQKEQLLEFDLKLSGGKGTVLSRLLSKATAPVPPMDAEQFAAGEKLFTEAMAQKKVKNYDMAAVPLEKCVRVAPAYHPCYRLLGSVYASLATRDQSATYVEKARQMYERYLEVAPPDDEYVPKVAAILEAAGDEPPVRDAPVVLDDPAPSEQTLTLAAGQSKVVKVPGVARIALGDPSVADVKTVGNEELLVKGVSAGMTTMLVWTSDGQRQATLIQVTGKSSVSPSTDVLGEDDDFTTLTVGGQTRLSFGKPVTRVAVGDEAIADVEAAGPRQVLVKGVQEGSTTVLVWFGTQRKAILVTVVSGVPSPMAKVFHQARRASAAGDWPHAVELARQVLKAEPGHEGALALLEEARQEAREAYLRGYQLREQNPTEARREFSVVLALTPPGDETHQKAKARLAELAP